jgi:hypothetical protein
MHRNFSGTTEAVKVTMDEKLVAAEVLQLESSGRWQA